MEVAVNNPVCYSITMIDPWGVAVLIALLAAPFLIALVKDIKGKRNPWLSKKTTNNMSDEDLRKYLIKFKPQLEQTKREYIQITASVSQNKLDQTRSKFGGLPYFPKLQKYPLDYLGQKMYFLAEINLAEVPHIHTLPTKGILQFFIKGPDIFSDLNFTDIGKISHVIYYANITHKDIIQDPVFFPHLTSNKKFVLGDEFELKFAKKQEIISTEDYRFNQLPSSIDKDFLEKIENNPSKIIEQYLGLNMDGTGHKILGYPHFAQEDIRIDEKVKQLSSLDDPYELLFQIDSQFNENSKKWEIIWGDAGVGNFFIRMSDLRKLDFSKVIFTWDCY